MKFIYMMEDPEVLRSEGRVILTVSINDEDGKKAAGIIFTFKYFPVLNVLMQAIIQKLNLWKKLPDSWKRKNISIIGLLDGKYDGFKHLHKLIEGAELWTLKK